MPIGFRILNLLGQINTMLFQIHRYYIKVDRFKPLITSTETPNHRELKKLYTGYV